MRMLTGFMLSALLAGSALAANPAAIDQRRQAMKDIGAAMKILGEMVQGKSGFDAGQINTQASLIADRLEKAGDLFPPDSQEGPPETWAKPEIWQDKATFDSRRQKARDAATKLASVTEPDQFTPAMQGLGASCKSCHENFRRPKD